MSKLLIAKSSVTAIDIDDKPVTPAPIVETHWDVPPDVRLAITREAERDPSDPYVARRLMGHYRQGIWGPQDARK